MDKIFCNTLDYDDIHLHLSSMLKEIHVEIFFTCSSTTSMPT